jgi:hypothetical protein
MTKLKISLLNVKLSQQETEEKREANARRLSFIKFPPLLLLLLLLLLLPTKHSKPRHHASSWNDEIKKNDSGIL